jgi:hypothetical protein
MITLLDELMTESGAEEGRIRPSLSARVHDGFFNVVLGSMLSLMVLAMSSSLAA